MGRTDGGETLINSATEKSKCRGESAIKKSFKNEHP